MGDFAAAGLLLLGAHCWLKGHDDDVGRQGWLAVVGAGVCLALMVAAKSSYAVMAMGFVAFAIHDWTGERRLKLRAVLVPVLCVLAINLPWELYSKGQDQPSHLEHAASHGAGLVYATPGLSHLAEKARETLGRPEYALSLAGLVWGPGAGGTPATPDRAARLPGACLASLVAELRDRAVPLPDRPVFAPRVGGCAAHRGLFAGFAAGELARVAADVTDHSGIGRRGRLRGTCCCQRLGWPTT